VSDDLTSTVGIVALAAAAVAVAALVLAAVLTIRMRRLQEAQKFVLGETDEQDIVAHAQSLHQGFDRLHGQVQNTFDGLERRIADAEHRLEHSISRSAVVRYDAYNEMSGRQSSSIALLDDTGTGVVMSSILHRDQARLYVKNVQAGQSDFELSPEEQEAIQTAQPARPRQPQPPVQPQS
jgi:uncharacterized protein DUF4446